MAGTTDKIRRRNFGSLQGAYRLWAAYSGQIMHPDYACTGHIHHKFRHRALASLAALSTVLRAVTVLKVLDLQQGVRLQCMLPYMHRLVFGLMQGLRQWLHCDTELQVWMLSQGLHCESARTGDP